MILRLLTMILAIVFISLGIPFLVLGFVLDDPEADGFRVIGAATLVVGLVLAGVFLTLRRRAKAERERRQAQTSVEIVRANLNQYTRVGVMLTYDLAIRYADGRTYTRKVLVPPARLLKAGERVDVRYDPADPGNFEVGG